MMLTARTVNPYVRMTPPSDNRKADADYFCRITCATIEFGVNNLK
jgi:hypothetical protein